MVRTSERSSEHCQWSLWWIPIPIAMLMFAIAVYVRSGPSERPTREAAPDPELHASAVLLMEDLQASDVATRLRAVRRARKVTGTRPSRILFDRLTEEPENLVRLAIAEEIGRLRDFTLRDEIRRLLDSSYREEAAIAFSGVTREDDIRVLDELSQDSIPNVRLAAMRGVGNLKRSKNAYNSLILESGLRDSDERVRLEALRSIRSVVPDKTALAMLQSLSEEDDPGLKRAAAAGLAMTSGEGR